MYSCITNPYKQLFLWTLDKSLFYTFFRGGIQEILQNAWMGKTSV